MRTKGLYYYCKSLAKPEVVDVCWHDAKRLAARINEEFASGNTSVTMGVSRPATDYEKAVLYWCEDQGWNIRGRRNYIGRRYVIISFNY